MVLDSLLIFFFAFFSFFLAHFLFYALINYKTLYHMKFIKLDFCVKKKKNYFLVFYADFQIH